MLSPSSETTPEPALLRVTAEFPSIAPVTTVLPLPWKTSWSLLPLSWLISPESVSVPASLEMRVMPLAATAVISPSQVLFPEILRSTPPVPLPWPVRVARWPVRVMLSWRSSDAPLATVTEEEPSAAEWRRLRTPTLTVVGPVFELDPDRTSVPAPVLVTPPLPLITPLTVVVLDGMLKVVAASSVRMPPRLWATLAVLVTAGALPARKSASPVRLTAPLVRLSLLASSRPRLLLEEIEALLLKTMVVSKAETGCCGDQTAVLQLPELAVVKTVGVTAGTMVIWVEFALSTLPLRALTT